MSITITILRVDLNFPSLCHCAVNLGPPTNFEITDIATESLTFRWDPPYDSNDLTINTYTVTCTPVFQEAIEATVDASITVVIIDKFLPGTNYTCSVYATNDVGDGSTAEQYATTLESKNKNITPNVLMSYSIPYS